MQRFENYQASFRYHLHEAAKPDIGYNVNTGLVLGSGRFKDELAENMNRKTRLAASGRPKKS